MNGDVVALDHRRRAGRILGGWHVDGAGPIPRAYTIDGALWRDCGCGAVSGQACIGPYGVLRRVPCVARLRAAARQAEDQATQPGPRPDLTTVQGDGVPDGVDADGSAATR